MLVRLLVYGFLAAGAVGFGSTGLLAQPALMRSGAPLPGYANDASLHGIFFLDPDLGWACGDRGTVLVTIDGGRKWDAVATGQEGTLRAIHFFDAQRGIALGGQSSGLAGGSQALLLESIDGGRSWKRISSDLPAIHAAGFLDADAGWAIGDCSSRYPSGYFRTRDGGATWTPSASPAPGPWLCGAFASPQEGVVAGYESIAAQFAAKGFMPIELGGASPLALRCAAALPHGQLLMAGERGTVYRLRRGKPPQLLSLGEKQTAAIDFHAATVSGENTWLAGSPGTFVYHSSDAGATWKRSSTGQSAPIRALHFLDAERGFAVGDLGLVMATRDGGQTWRVQRRAGEFAAYLGVFSEMRRVPWELFARLSGQEGHYGHLLCASARRSTSTVSHAADADLLHRAITRLGGGGGSVLPDYPLDEASGGDSLARLEKEWRRGDQAARERMEKDLARQIRLWRPEVIFTELPPADDRDAVGQIVTQSLLSAVASAAGGETIGDDGLAPWQVKRVYAVQAGRRGFKTVESAQLATRLGRSLQEAAWPARRECEAEEILAPELFGLQLLLDHTDNDASRSDLFSGIRIEMGGPRRRALSEPQGTTIEAATRRAARHHDVIKLLREAQEALKPKQIDPQRVVKAIDGLDAEFCAQALFTMGQIAERRGNREAAITAWSELNDGLPGHPLSERGMELRFALSSSAERLWKDKQTPTPSFASELSRPNPPPSALSQPAVAAGAPPGAEGAPVSANMGNQASQEIVELLRPESRGAPAARFAAAALQRESSDPALAYDFYRSFAKKYPHDWLASAAQAESWLVAPNGACPKPIFSLTRTEQRPYLDGKLDEPMWQGKGLRLTAAGERKSSAACWLSRDGEHLYFAVRCETTAAPSGKERAPRRDAEEDRTDRVELLLDVDRDWSTYYRLAVCEDGSTLDESGGDLTWNPKWYVAVSREEKGWSAECAIPLAELSPYGFEKGEAWAMGVQRRAAEGGMESWTHPASAKIVPAGFGLLLGE